MALADTIAEIRAALASLDREHEGLRDIFSVDDIQENTKAEVQAFIVIYNRRVDILRAALAALEALEADGYPDMPIREVAQAVYRDLVENIEAMRAALAKFSSADAVGFAFTTGPTVPK